MKYVINGVLTDLNNYINAERTNKFIAARMKKDDTAHVRNCVRGSKPIAGRHIYQFDWYAPNQKKDVDNISFAKKFCLDGLVAAGVIENDGWNQVAGFVDNFHVDKDNPRIEITLIPA